MHVDYWDYLGWNDPFGQHKFTARQKAYARAADERTVYTPQMIIEGRDELISPTEDDLNRIIAREKARPRPARLQITRTGDRYEVALFANQPLDHPAVVQVVRYIPGARVDILHGENAGKTVNYTDIVTGWRTVADWDGASPTHLTIEVDGDDKAVLLVQEALPGPDKAVLPGAIVAAGRLD